MIIDFSALVALILDEPEQTAFEDAISGDLLPRISAASNLEAGIVIGGQGSAKPSRLLDSYYLRRASP